MTYGQAVQFCPHLVIPFLHLLGYLVGAGGTLDFIRISLKLLCLLKATKGGCLKTSFTYWFCMIIALQCFAWMLWIGGNLGSYFIEKNSRFWFGLDWRQSRVIFQKENWLFLVLGLSYFCEGYPPRDFFSL